MQLHPTIERVLRGPWIGALVVVTALTSYALAYADNGEFEPLPPRAPEAPAAYTDEARALLRGLDVNDVIQGWRVAEIFGPVDQSVVIRFERQRVSLTFMVTRVDTLSVDAPIPAGPYGISYAPPSPADAVIDEDLPSVLGRSLSLRVDHDAPVPTGM